MKKWKYLMMYLLVALGVFVASYEASQWYLTGKIPLPFSFRSNPPTPQPTVSILPTPASTTGQSIKRFQGYSGTIYYLLIGTFRTNTITQGNAVTGEFVIEEDPQKTPLTATIDVSQGTALFVAFPNSFEDEADSASVSASTLLSRLRKDTRAALFIKAEENPQLSTILDAALADSWNIPAGQKVTTFMVGVVGK